MDIANIKFEINKPNKALYPIKILSSLSWELKFSFLVMMKTIKIKLDGTFVVKPIKVKVGGIFK